MAGALVTTNILQTVVSMGLSALRERIVLAKVVNRDYEGELTSQSKNATVNISVPAAVASRSVSPDVVPPAVTAVTPTSIALSLSQWREAPFAMDDKGLAQVNRGILPQQASEAVKTIANDIDAYIWGLTHGADGFYGYAGTAGTTPFATDLAEYLSATQQADAQLMPADNRYVILDTFAKANALGTNAVQNASWRGSPDAFRTGNIGEVLGANWDYSQNVPLHTAGTAAGATTDSTGYAAGLKTITLASAGTGSILVGDIILFAGDTQPYVVTSGDASVAAGGTVSFEPGLKIALAASAVAITVKASHRCNLLIHRDAIAFAMSPLKDSAAVDGVPVAQAIAMDPDSGLALRLEVTRQHRQYQWAFDALYGAAVVRRGFGVRIAG
jgi:hypothetical protein